MPEPFTTRIADLYYSETAALFQGEAAGAGVTAFILHTPPGAFVGLHTHPYPETFFLLAGKGRWTAGDAVIEAEGEQIVSVPAGVLHGFRNVGDEPFVLISVHESPTLVQSAFGDPPA